MAAVDPNLHGNELSFSTIRGFSGGGNGRALVVQEEQGHGSYCSRGAQVGRRIGTL
jgi:hypothetical protein